MQGYFVDATTAQAYGIDSVRMAHDLVRAGIELPGYDRRTLAVTAMPAHYARNETAAKGAAARFYGAWRS